MFVEIKHSYFILPPMKFLKYLFSFLCFSYIHQTNAQCATEPLSYTNNFMDSTANSCWNTGGGTYPSFFGGDDAILTSPNQNGSSILESPEFYIDRPFRFNYGMHHQKYPITHSLQGWEDSLAVQYKSKSASNWTTIKAYPKGFATRIATTHTDQFIYEEFSFGSQFIGDTLKFRFVYTTDANPYYNYEAVVIEAVRLQAEADSVYSLPFYENFDGNAWTSISGSYPNWSYDTDSAWYMLPWNDANINAFKWMPKSDTTPSANTGPPNDFSTNGKYMYTEASRWGGDAIMETPLMNFTGVSYPTLSFAYHMYGADMGILEVEQWINGNWITLDTIQGQQQGPSDPWKIREILMDSTDFSKVRFTLIKNNNGSLVYTQDAAIDEVKVFSGICPVPRNYELQMISRTDSSLTLSGVGPAVTAYVVEYGPKNFAAGSGQFDTITQMPFILGSLAPDTEYDVYIQFFCGIADSTRILGPFTFKTYCLTQNAPYSETFDLTTIPSCWYAPNPTRDSLYSGSWKISSSSGNFPAYGAQNMMDHSNNGGYAIGVDGSLSDDSVVSLFSPFIDITGLTIPKMSFWLFSNNINNPGDNNGLFVDFFDGEKWHEHVLTYRGDHPQWQKAEYIIPIDSVKGPIAFRVTVNKDANTPYYNDILVDDFEVIDSYTNACPLPDNLSWTRKGCNEAIISWNSDPSIISSDIIYGTKGFNPLTAGNRINNISNPFELQNIPHHDTLDFYIVDSCQAGLGFSSSSINLDSLYIAPQITVNTRLKSFTSTTITYVFDASNSTPNDSVLWDFGNGVILKGDSVEFTFNSNQTAHIDIYSYSDCGNGQQTFSMLIDNISTTELSLDDEIMIFPNPVRTNLHIAFPKGIPENLRYLLFDERGSLVLQKESSRHISVDNEVLDLQYLSPGIYSLSIINDKGLFVQRRILILP